MNGCKKTRALMAAVKKAGGGKVQTSSDTARKLATEMGGMKKGGAAKDKSGLAVMIAIGKTKPVKRKEGGTAKKKPTEGVSTRPTTASGRRISDAELRQANRDTGGMTAAQVKAAGKAIARGNNAPYERIPTDAEAERLMRRADGGVAVTQDMPRMMVTSAPAQRTQDMPRTVKASPNKGLALAMRNMPPAARDRLQAMMQAKQGQRTQDMPRAQVLAERKGMFGKMVQNLAAKRAPQGVGSVPGRHRRECCLSSGSRCRHRRVRFVGCRKRALETGAARRRQGASSEGLRPR